MLRISRYWLLMRSALMGCAAALLFASPVFSQESPPSVEQPGQDEAQAREEIRKAEEVTDEEKTRKFEQTQYELNEMGMSLEERKMRRQTPQRP